MHAPDREPTGELDATHEATVVLTGATTGIGRATALTIAHRAGRLILHGLEHEREVADLLRSVRAAMRPGTELSYVPADYGDLADVTKLARRIRETTDRVDLLVNNAARPGPPTRTVNDAGTEVTLQTNYLAPVLLTTSLLDLVGHGRRGRVLNIGSATHLTATLHPDDLNLAHHPYSPSTAYAHSKLALITYSCWLAGHRPSPSLDVVSMHPGVISTGLLHAMFSIPGDQPEHAAANIRYVAARHDDNGTYYDERTPRSPNPQALDQATQDRLHEITSRVLRDHL